MEVVYTPILKVAGENIDLTQVVSISDVRYHEPTDSYYTHVKFSNKDGGTSLNITLAENDTEQSYTVFNDVEWKAAYQAMGKTGVCNPAILIADGIAAMSKYFPDGMVELYEGDECGLSHLSEYDTIAGLHYLMGKMFVCEVYNAEGRSYLGQYAQNRVDEMVELWAGSK